MPEDQTPTSPTVALKTKVEDDFVAPLSAIRGLLELIRDFPDIDAEKRGNFARSALAECARLERGIEELAETVYASGHQAISGAQTSAPQPHGEYRERIQLHPDLNVVEVDFSEFEFKSSELVNAFHDEIEAAIDATNRKWYVIVDHTRCRVWPEAWVAFAHRGKRITVTRSLGSFRFVTDPEEATAGSGDSNMLASRDIALAQVEAAKKTPT